MGWQIRRWHMRSYIDYLIEPVQRYLALAALLGAGANGIERAAALTAKDLHDASAAELTPNERASRGITERMSLSWEEARQRLESDSALIDILGKDLVKAYLSANLVRYFTLLSDCLRCLLTFD